MIDEKEHLTDISDIATKREEEEREYRIAEVRRRISIHPVLDCLGCQSIEQSEAKQSCRDYGSCIADHERMRKAREIGGRYAE